MVSNSGKSFEKTCTDKLKIISLPVQIGSLCRRFRYVSEKVLCFLQQTLKIFYSFNKKFNMYTYNDIALMIDHSLLNPTLTDNDIIAGCRLADEYKVATVCVRPGDVKLADKLLKNSPVKVTTVIGFPHGTTTTLTKLAEAQEAIENGCEELDVVINIGKMKSGGYDYVKRELQAVIAVAHARDVKVKVIFENTYLTKDEIKTATLICNDVNADWVKTSTGYAGGGATDEDLVIMRSNALPHIQVKAAGGVRTLERAIQVRELGCTRFGATATKVILDALKDDTVNADPSGSEAAY
jgi:deoxyribose-phosphate aldolase